jgi:hypothetical protein
MGAAGERISAASHDLPVKLGGMGSGIIYGVHCPSARKIPPRRKEVYPEEHRDIRWEPPDWPDGLPANFQDPLSSTFWNREGEEGLFRERSGNPDENLFLNTTVSPVRIIMLLPAPSGKEGMPVSKGFRWCLLRLVALPKLPK